MNDLLTVLPALGQSAGVASSHLVMCITLILLIARMVRIMHFPQMRAVFASTAPVAVCIAALGIFAERFYYFTARILQSLGSDLWSLHPAPEMLSLLMTLGMFALHIAAIHAQLLDPRRVAMRAGLEFGALIGLWIIIRAVLV